MLNISLSISGHKEILYILLFNGLLSREEMLEARELFEDRSSVILKFQYKILTDRLFKDEL